MMVPYTCMHVGVGVCMLCISCQSKWHRLDLRGNASHVNVKWRVPFVCLNYRCMFKIQKHRSRTQSKVPHFS